MSREARILSASTAHCLEAAALTTQYSSCKKNANFPAPPPRKKNCHSLMRIFIFRRDESCYGKAVGEGFQPG